MQRVGHVLDHTKKAKRQSMGQSWFPKSWTSKDIKKIIQCIIVRKWHTKKAERVCDILLAFFYALI